MSIGLDSVTTDRSVLVVEDNEDHQIIVRSMLEERGYGVTLCPALHEALDFLSNAEFCVDLVVLDLALPDHGGDFAVDMVRSVTAVPVLVYSAANEPLAAAALAAGATDFVSKSAPLHVLDEAVTAVFAADQTPMEPIPGASRDLLGTSDFSALADQTVHVMAEVCDIKTWLVTRVHGDDWIVLAASDDHFGIRPGDVLRWSDSICSRMVHGLGPRVEPDVDSNDVYRRAPITAREGIGCYVGLPLAVKGEGLFGTLCGISPEPHGTPADLVGKLPIFEMMARMLASALAADLFRTRLERRLLLADAAATCDVMTGLGNRRAWERAVRAEDERCERFGHTAGVIAIDLDGLKAVNDRRGHAAGDALIRDTSAVLVTETRQFDQPFRLGGDEFTVLCPEVTAAGVDAVADRIRDALRRAGISASVGCALRTTGQKLADAAERADAAMYAEKPWS